jgi:hypothetical protein
MTAAPDERQPWELEEQADVPTTSEPIREEERGELGESDESDRPADQGPPPSQTAPGADPNESATSDQSPGDEGGAPA